MTTTNPTPEPQTGGVPVLNLPLAKIRRSPFNYRKTHVDLQQLAASIRDQGVQQPIKVRPVPADENGCEYELVFGERRFLASAKAGRTDIPAIVEILRDDEVQAIQLVENSARADVHPLEEAEGLERLLTLQGSDGALLYTVATIATLIGRSEQHVYGRLKLTALVPAARKAFYAGALTPTTALLVARVPASLQERALKEITAPKPYSTTKEPMTAREATEHIQSRYMLRLDAAPFPTADADLVASVGPCGSCPKRTGNAKLLFADVQRDDLCTDPDCYANKVKARWARAVADAREMGHDVLSEAENKRVFSGRNLAYGTRYVDLADPCDHDLKRRPWRKVLAKAEPKLTIGRDESGRVHELVRADDAMQLALEAGLVKKSAGAPGPQPQDTRDAGREQGAKVRAESALRREMVHAALEAIVSKVEKREADKAFWIVWLQGILRGSWHDSIREVCKRRGIVYDQATQPSGALEKAAQKMTGDQLRALALELTLSRGLYSFFPGANNDFGPVFKQACETYGIELPALKKAAKVTLEDKKERARKHASAKKAA